MCLIFVSLVCIESIIAAFCSIRKGKAPVWLKMLIIISTPHKFWKWLKARLATRCSDERCEIGIHPESNVELVVENPTRLQYQADEACNTKISGTTVQEQTSDQSVSTSLNKRNLSTSVVTSGTVGTSVKLSLTESNDTQAVSKDTEADEFGKYSWAKGSRAIDRLCRWIVPVVFAIAIATFMKKQQA